MQNMQFEAFSVKSKNRLKVLISGGFSWYEWCYGTLDESQLNQRFEDIEKQYLLINYL